MQREVEDSFIFVVWALVSGKFVVTDHGYCVFKSSLYSGQAIHLKDLQLL